MFLDHPLAGVGMEGVERAYKAYYAGLEPADKMYAAHDIFLQFLADTGLIGFSGLLAVFAGFFAAARRLDRAGFGGSALRYLAAAGATSGLLQNNFRDSEFLYCFWFLTAALSVLARAHFPQLMLSQRGEPRREPRRKPLLQPFR
jgi:O-antigen ligase